MKKQFSSVLIIAAIIVVIIIFFSSSMFYTLQPGERGVIFRRFSTNAEKLDKNNIITPGFQVIAPWNDIFVYNVKEQTSEETMDVLDKNGLSISVDVSVRFNPIYNRIGYLHEKFGRGYVNTLVIPEVRSTVRQVMGRYTAEEIYSTKRKAVETAIIDESTEILRSKKNNIEVTALLIRSINLPTQIKQAIENKLKQEQEALAYRFKLEKEKSEAKRKQIAAEGEARANKIINSSLTSALLKMRGIEATIKLSESQNAKVIIIGNSEDGLPLILGNN
ncbi:MAG: prohibitin family protein [Chlorobi bacterium]|nr:prohibitin family protein [Chlorobiota bacterium]